MSIKTFIGIPDTSIKSVMSAPVANIQSIQGSLLNQKYLYGFINKVFQKPVDFTPTLPCSFYRDGNNVIQNDMDFTQYTGGTKKYVNYDTGNDANNGSTIALACKTITGASYYASIGADASYCITVLSDSVFLRDDAVLTAPTNKLIAIIPQNVSNRVVISFGLKSLSWVEDGAGTWKATGAAVRAVYDVRVVDGNGLQIPFTGKNTLVECQAAIKTWYTDGTYVWVHTNDGLIPDANIIVGRWNGFSQSVVGTSKLYLKNITNLGSSIGESASFLGDATGATVVGEVVCDGCYFIGGHYRVGSDTGNAFANVNIKKSYLFNCKAAYAKADGFNFHYINVPAANRRDCLVVLFNCESYNNGLTSTGTANNGSTCHEGVNIIRFRENDYNTHGPVTVDVNGCYSILVDCNARDNTGNTGAFYFDNQSNPLGVTGKLLMYNCTHLGETLGTKDLFIQTSFDATLYATPFINLVTGSGTPTYIPPL
jgi:hypothetical protein